jgi:uncharacterized protein YndB with AHSA1/START domain
MSREPVEREIEVDASPAEVWESLADPGRRGEWLDADVEIDLRPAGGGTFRFAGGETRRARVVDVDPGRRISFAWWPVAPVVGRPTLVTITVEPCEVGSRLRVREAPSARALSAA